MSYRVICVELRGRGLSEYAKDLMTYVPPTYVRDIETLLKVAQLPPVVLIDTSLGGIISMLLSASMPKKILGVILNNIGLEINSAGFERISRYFCSDEAGFAASTPSYGS